MCCSFSSSLQGKGASPSGIVVGGCPFLLFFFLPPCHFPDANFFFFLPPQSARGEAKPPSPPREGKISASPSLLFLPSCYPRKPPIPSFFIGRAAPALPSKSPGGSPFPPLFLALVIKGAFPLRLRNFSLFRQSFLFFLFFANGRPSCPPLFPFLLVTTADGNSFFRAAFWEDGSLPLPPTTGRNVPDLLIVTDLGSI